MKLTKLFGILRVLLRFQNFFGFHKNKMSVKLRELGELPVQNPEKQIQVIVKHSTPKMRFFRSKILVLKLLCSYKGK